LDIAGLQTLAVATWLQSFDSVRGPVERLGIMGAPQVAVKQADWANKKGARLAKFDCP